MKPAPDRWTDARSLAPELLPMASGAGAALLVRALMGSPSPPGPAAGLRAGAVAFAEGLLQRVGPARHLVAEALIAEAGKALGLAPAPPRAAGANPSPVNSLALLALNGASRWLERRAATH